jgi:hypothetical protein
MSWRQLLASGSVRKHAATRQELDNLRPSADRRFATAYNAALQLAKMVIAPDIESPLVHATTN